MKEKEKSQKIKNYSKLFTFNKCYANTFLMEK